MGIPSPLYLDDATAQLEPVWLGSCGLQIAPAGGDQPRQQHDGEAKRRHGDDDDGALRPGAEGGDEGRDFARVRRIAEEAVIGAEPHVERQITTAI